jgi:hypothetical protein
MPTAGWISLLQNRVAPFVDLEWLDNTEPDLAGYNVYRSTTSGSGFVKLNHSLILVSNFRDKTPLDPAVTNYFYRVTAVDTTGNESSVSSEAQTIGATQPITLVGMVGIRGAA